MDDSEEETKDVENKGMLKNNCFPRMPTTENCINAIFNERYQGKEDERGL